MSVSRDARFRCECNTAPSADVYDTMLVTRRELDEAQRLVTWDIGGPGVAAFLGAATIAILAPSLALPLAIAVTVTGVGYSVLKVVAANKAETSQNMASYSRILSKVEKDLAEEGVSALLKYAWLIGKNISGPEYVHEMWEAGQLAIRPDYESDPT